MDVDDRDFSPDDPDVPDGPDAGGRASADRAAWLRRPWAVAAGVVLALGVAAFVLVRLRVATSLGIGAVCGNGAVEGDEECDDGNNVLTDGCLRCKLATCGDGVKRDFVEECDDGNRVTDDGCSVGCVACPVGPSSFASPAGHCYWRESTPLPFAAAAEVCREKKGYLVTYAVDLEWREITEHLFSTARQDSNGAWIGLRNETRNGVRDFGWMSGERLLFSHWAIHEPKRAPGHNCTAQAEPGTWAAVPCEEPREFICERPRWWRAPQDGRAFRRFVERQRWDEAAETCRKNGGRLVTFRDIADQERTSRRYPGAIWIGARSDSKTKEFTWADGSPLPYRDFAPGEPNFLDDQHCVALDIDGRWYNRECTDRYGFVCEVLN
jgi:cysteine-rich repeat protein